MYSNKNLDGEYAFGWCCRYGHIEMAKRLLETGKVNMNQDDDYAFRESCRNGHLEISKWLFSMGVDSNAREDYALMWSCKNNHMEMSKWLYEIGGMGVLDSEIFIDTCENGHLEMSQWLYNYIKISDYCIIRAIMRSTIGGNLEMLQWLNTLTLKNRTYDVDQVFINSCSYNSLEIAKWLYSLNPELDKDSAFGKSCENGHIEIAKWLHSLGVNIHAKDEYAFRHCDHNMLNWLLLLYDDTLCLVEFLQKDITTIPLYKKGETIVAMGEVVSSGEMTDDEAMSMYLKSTETLRMKRGNFTKKPVL